MKKITAEFKKFIIGNLYNLRHICFVTDMFLYYSIFIDGLFNYNLVQ